MDVSHLEGGSDDETLELIQMILSELGPYLYPRTEGFSNTLNEMVAKGYRALVTFDDQDLIANYSQLWFDSTVINSYANSDNLTFMEAYNTQQAETFLASNKTFPMQLFLMSWTLTPNTDTVLKVRLRILLLLLSLLSRIYRACE